MNDQRLEYKQGDFDWITWSSTDINQAAEAALLEKSRIYQLVKSIPAAERTFKNTIYAIESSGDLLGDVCGKFNLLMQASTDAAIRDASQSAINLISERLVDIEYDPELYRTVQEFAKRQIALTGADGKLFKDMLREYKRMGFDLPDKDREKLKNNLKRSALLGVQFERNIADSDGYIVVTQEQLNGLPESYVAGLEQITILEKYASHEPLYKISLKYPDYFPFMDYARDGKARAELYLKFNQRGGEKNLEIISEIIKLRDENAKLLGYASHAAYQTEVSMAKTAKAVRDFLADLRLKVKSLCNLDINDLVVAKHEESGTDQALLQSDIRYYIQRLQEKRFFVDNEKVREYFPLPKVIDGMFKIYQTLLNIRILETQEFPLWHEEARLFRVTDNSLNLMGYFVLDLYPRPNKFNHAAVFPIIRGRNMNNGDGYSAPFVAMLCNFAKGTSEVPSLLPHQEVDTFFHEFGHVMHGVLTKAPYGSQSGTSVARDFVEAPSQMLENWVWDKEMLKLLSAHFKTGEALPEELLNNMIKAKNHMIGYVTMRQLILATFDMSLHDRADALALNARDICKIYADLVKEWIDVAMPEGQIFPASFGHLNGYDAGYYGYMWSKVYSSDMFTRFSKAGLLNIEVGRDYREQILEPGSSREEIESLIAFLGRKPSSQAFLKEIGLSSAS